MQTDSYDVAVVGGGAAGLSAALVLGRARRRVVVIDAGAPRNAPAAHMHGFLSRDGMPPAEFLATGRAELLSYDVDLVEDDVVEVDGAFPVRLASGRRITVIDGRVARFTVLDDQLHAVELADGRLIPRAAVFMVPTMRLRAAELIGSLGCELDGGGFVRADPMLRTSVPGVWVAGN